MSRSRKYFSGLGAIRFSSVSFDPCSGLLLLLLWRLLLLTLEKVVLRLKLAVRRRVGVVGLALVQAGKVVSAEHVGEFRLNSRVSGGQAQYRGLALAADQFQDGSLGRL